MNYPVWRKHAIRNIYDSTINEFVKCYQCGRPTIVLLPGAMGSHLERSTEAYQRNQVPSLTKLNYEVVWFDINTLIFGLLPSLRIENNGRDRDNRVVVADGPLRDIYIPYNETERFFKDRDVNYIVFGYDWRRPIDDSAKLLKYFLTRLKKLVFKKFKEDPLPNLTLLAHSMGGLVAKIFLHKVGNIDGWIKQLITVATPFYGTSTHQQRYFIGLDILDGYNIQRKEMASITASLPGPYNLMFLPKPIFKEYKSEIGLNRYPIRNSKGDAGADPYDEKSLRLYPDKWISSTYLVTAREIYNIIAEPFPDDVAQRVYNIRSVHNKETPVELVWHPLPEDFDPDEEESPDDESAVRIPHESPVKVHTRGSGDGTVPAWSAYHISVPGENRKELTNSKDHAFLMEDHQVLEQVDTWVKDQPTIAPESDVKKILSEIATRQVSDDDSRLTDQRIGRRIYQGLVG